MGISYSKLFKILQKNGLKKTEFARNAGISGNTLAKLSKDEQVSMEVMVRVCTYLKCDIGDIMEVLPETEQEKNL